MGGDDDTIVLNWQSPHSRALSYINGRVFLVYGRVKLTDVRVKYILCNNHGGARFSEFVPDIRRVIQRSVFIGRRRRKRWRKDENVSGNLQPFDMDPGPSPG